MLAFVRLEGSWYTVQLDSVSASGPSEEWCECCFPVIGWRVNVGNFASALLDDYPEACRALLVCSAVICTRKTLSVIY